MAKSGFVINGDHINHEALLFERARIQFGNFEGVYADHTHPVLVGHHHDLEAFGIGLAANAGQAAGNEFALVEGIVPQPDLPLVRAVIRFGIRVFVDIDAFIRSFAESSFLIFFSLPLFPLKKAMHLSYLLQEGIKDLIINQPNYKIIHHII